MAPTGTGVGRGWLVTLLSGVLLAYVLVVLSFGVFSFDFMISLINLVFSELPLVNVMKYQALGPLVSNLGPMKATNMYTSGMLNRENHCFVDI